MLSKKAISLAHVAGEKNDGHTFDQQLQAVALKDLGDLYTESGQTSQCSFSSVSTPPIARVGSFSPFFEIVLQDFHSLAPLRQTTVRKSAGQGSIPEAL